MTASPPKDPAAVTGPRALVALVVFALAGGALGIGLGLRHDVHPTVKVTRTADAASPAAASPPIPVPTRPPAMALPTPTPWQAPSTIAYVAPGSFSFPTTSAGWVLGDACDAQKHCETGVARTTDGGASWAMVAPPAAPDPTTSELQLAAGSSEDAWVWGTGSGGDAVFAATHDGGESWQPDAAGGQVVDVAIADGTAWAVTGCAREATAACRLAVLSSPVGGGAWTGLAPLPAAVQGEPISNGELGAPQLVRSGASAWLLNDNLSQPALVTTGDAGRSWTSVSLPPLFAPYLTIDLASSAAGHLMLAFVGMGGWPAPQEVWTSDDGGAQWQLRARANESSFTPPVANVGSLDNDGAPNGLDVISSTSAWMLNARGYPLVTEDDGVTWTEAPVPAVLTTDSDAGANLDVTFANALDGWVCGSAGLWTTIDGGVHWHAQPIIGPVPGWSSSP